MHIWGVVKRADVCTGIGGHADVAVCRCACRGQVGAQVRLYVQLCVQGQVCVQAHMCKQVWLCVQVCRGRWAYRCRL